MGEMKPTPVIIRNFVSYIKRVFPVGFDFSIIGFDINDRESVKRFLVEECEDLEYHECIRKILKAYESIVSKEYDYVSEAQRQMNYYLGTPYVSEAFKKIYSKYKDRIIDLLLGEDHGELSLIEDYLTAKYGCIDYDIRRLTELPQLGIKAQLITGDINLFAYQVSLGYNLTQTDSRLELFALSDNLYLASTQNDYYLICIREYIDEKFIGTIITSSDKPFLLFSLSTRKYAIIA